MLNSTAMYLYPEIKNVILKDLNVSVVMPFYKKNGVFRQTITINERYFARPGIEVILCIDEPFSEKELIPILNEYAHINWKVFRNRSPHEWRNPSKAINVGIRNASREFVLVMGPDSEMYTDVLLEFRCRNYFYADCYFVGKVAFITQDIKITKVNSKGLVYFPYGSIFARKKYFESVTGYNESLDKWGGDDDNIRMRLSRSGLTKMFVDEAILLHRDRDLSENVERYRKAREMPVSVLKQLFLDNIIDVNGDHWGNDFNEQIYPL